jgi:hypothetical protein
MGVEEKVAMALSVYRVSSNLKLEIQQKVESIPGGKRVMEKLVETQIKQFASHIPCGVLSERPSQLPMTSGYSTW